MLCPCSTAVLNCIQVKLQAFTIQLFFFFFILFFSFAAQAPDATTGSLALQDNEAKPEGQTASEVGPADDKPRKP